MVDAQIPRLHLLFRRTFFVCAGGVACLILAGLALNQWDIDWPLIIALTILGTAAAGIDVLLFEHEDWSILKAFLIWGAGFLCLSILMIAVLSIPYAVLAGISKAFGFWEAWETATYPWTFIIPLVFGACFGYLAWRLLDDR